jgi:hypothetical protein
VVAVAGPVQARLEVSMASRLPSPYYPPRARWYAPLLGVGGALRRRLALDRARWSRSLRFGGLLASLLVPGLGFYLRGPRVWGRLALAVCFFLLLLFFVEIGYPAGNMAFGLLLSVHAMGALCLCESSLADLRFRTRILLSMALLFVLAGLLYLPARRLMEAHLLEPLRVNNRVIVVKKSTSLPRVKRHDWIAYTIAGDTDHAAYVQAGLGLGPVLAVSGDHLHFTKAGFEVNGVLQPRLAHMPEEGEWVVPEKHWFVWPELDITGHGNVPEATLSATLLRMATISEDQFAGKPFKRWFWRRQFSS